MSPDPSNRPLFLGKLAPTFILLAVFLSAPSVRAQVVEITANATYDPAETPSISCTSPCPVVFNATFEVNTTTNTIVPGSMNFTESDPFGLGPFTAPSGSFAGGFGNWTSPSGWIIQIEFSSFPIPMLTYPELGTYTPQDISLDCFPTPPATACTPTPIQTGFVDGFNIPTTGSLEITATPEPPTFLLFGVGLGVMVVAASKLRR
jgi:hypothetical protein